MAEKPQLTIDQDALAKLLREHFTDVIDAKGDEVAANLRKLVPDDVPVGSMSQVNWSGRPISLVTILHASGMARQAKDGVVTLAAAQAGLDVSRYDPDDN